MPDWSRRRTLQAVATAGAAALAGCSEDSTDSRDGPHTGDGRPVADYDAASVRTADTEPLVWTGDEGGRERETIVVVDSPDRREDVQFADRAPAGDLRAFVDATDFDTHASVLHATLVGACYDLRLVDVARSDALELSLCQTLRPADVECGTADRDLVVTAVRVPDEGDGVSSVSVGTAGDCGTRPDPVYPADGGDGA